MVRVLDADAYRFAQLLAKSANVGVRDLGDAVLAVAVPDLEKVGPKGYEHGWIYVGAPHLGAVVHHPEHGRGVVSRAGKATTGVRFDSGHHAAFEHRAGVGAPGEHFVDRKALRAPRKKMPKPTAVKPQVDSTAGLTDAQRRAVRAATRHESAAHLSDEGRVNTYKRLSPQEFAKLSPAHQQAIHDDAARIAESTATTTIPSNRTRYGTTIRGATPQYVNDAKELRTAFHPDNLPREGETAAFRRHHANQPGGEVLTGPVRRIQRDHGGTLVSPGDLQEGDKILVPIAPGQHTEHTVASVTPRGKIRTKTGQLISAPMSVRVDEFPATGTDAVARFNPASLSDDQLEERFRAMSRADTVDEKHLTELLDEMDRRERGAGNPADRIDALAAKGVPFHEAYAEVHGLDPAELDRQARASLVDTARRAGESREDAARRLYAEHVHHQMLAAEAATRGHLLSPEGRAKGVDPVTLFSGPVTRARKYGSEDLHRWWAGNPRHNYTQFRAGLFGRKRDREAAARTRLGGNGKDFL